MMVREEISMAHKIIKLFPNENMKIMTQMMKKKEKTCLKGIILKLLCTIPMILILITLNL